MKNSTVMKWVTGILEAVLGIPFIGGVLILSMSWAPLIVMLILHIITLAIAAKENTGKYGSISGIIASALGWIPILGMILHMVTAALLIVNAFKEQTAPKEMKDS